MLDQGANEAEEEDIARQDMEQKQKLLAVITEKWLEGAWIGSDGSSADCGSGQAIWFEPAHVLEGSVGKGRWSLVGDQLHLVGAGDQPFDVTHTITQADAISFRATKSDGDTFKLRRCTRAETETLPDATPDGSVQE